MLETEANSIVATRREQAMTLIPALKRRAKFITTQRVEVTIKTFPELPCSRVPRNITNQLMRCVTSELRVAAGKGPPLCFVSFPCRLARLLPVGRLFGGWCFQPSQLHVPFLERPFFLSPLT